MALALPTPSLVVDLDVLEGNLDAMASLARTRSVLLRPHAKTHKSIDLARLQQEAGATGLTVATVGEAEVFAAAGFADLFIAYPLWVDPEKGRRLRGLLDTVDRLTIGVDSVEAGHALAAQLGDRRRDVEVLVEVDSGHHRSGLPPAEAGVLADQLEHGGLQVGGVFTFPGHAYSPDSRHDASRQEAKALATAADAVQAAGLDVPVVSGGSTPTAADVAAGSMTEMRPGVYVFGDAQQWELGSTTPDRIALTCWATVVSNAGGRVVLDAGSKVLGADRAPWATGHGRLLDHPDARIVLLSEHHAVVAWDHTTRPSLGSHVRVVPNHVCNAVNLVDTLTVVRSGRLVATWPVSARGANT